MLELRVLQLQQMQPLALRSCVAAGLRLAARALSLHACLSPLALAIEVHALPHALHAARELLEALSLHACLSPLSLVKWIILLSTLVVLSCLSAIKEYSYFFFNASPAVLASAI
jgi:hypothetical protein